MKGERKNTVGLKILIIVNDSLLSVTAAHDYRQQGGGLTDLSSDNTQPQ